jgi:hypothetical protein
MQEAKGRAVTSQVQDLLHNAAEDRPSQLRDELPAEYDSRLIQRNTELLQPSIDVLEGRRVARFVRKANEEVPRQAVFAQRGDMFQIGLEVTLPIFALGCLYDIMTAVRENTSGVRPRSNWNVEEVPAHRA